MITDLLKQKARVKALDVCVCVRRRPGRDGADRWGIAARRHWFRLSKELPEPDLVAHTAELRLRAREQRQ